MNITIRQNGRCYDYRIVEENADKCKGCTDEVRVYTPSFVYPCCKNMTCYKNLPRD